MSDTFEVSDICDCVIVQNCTIGLRVIYSRGLRGGNDWNHANQ